MSNQNSHLSNEAYRYDLVSALTQDTLNASLKQTVATAGAQTPPLTTYYRYNDPATHVGGTTVMTDEEVWAMTGGQDIFAIPDGTNSQDETYKELGDAMAAAGFAYAFRVGFGLPRGLAPAEMPDILTLTPPVNSNIAKNLAQTVQYTTYFASFELMKLTYGWNAWTVEQVAQPADQPWLFQWLVDLNITLPEDVSLADLPPTVQEHLKSVYNLDPATMFSLQQLMLDLNTPELVTGAQPTVIGFDPTDPLYADLNAFLNNYWLPLIANGGITFGNAVQPQGVYPAASIIPTALNFVVSPYSDPGRPGLSTLNYLVMSGNNPLPEPIVPFSWDWVDGSSPAPGIMAVRRDIFLDYLNAALAPSLAPLCMTVQVDIDENNEWYNHGDPAVSLHAGTITPKYTRNEAGLTFSHRSSQQDEQTVYLPTSHHDELLVALQVDSSVTVAGDTITCETTVALYYDYEVERLILGSTVSETRGYAFAQRNTGVFTMTAVGVGTTEGNSTAGMIRLTPRVAVEDLIQTADKNAPYYQDKASTWSKYLTGGDTGKLMGQVNALAATLQTLTEGYDTAIEGIINGSLAWVFPGAQTFFFSNPRFSDGQDLTVEIAYQG